MNRTTFLIPTLAVGLSAPAWGASFQTAPILPEEGVDVLNRSVTREQLDRDLFSSPYATVVVGHVDVYDRFPYLESRWFQVVSDPGWNRLLYGEVGGSLESMDGRDLAIGELRDPRGLSADEYGRVYVADAGNHRVLAFDTVSEFDDVRLVPAFTIEGLARPFDVAYSDAGTPFDRTDDRLYVADTGHNRVCAYDVNASGATFRAAIGELGSGAGRFAGPTALTVGRNEGRHTDDVYVADAHTGRLVHLVDRETRFDWDGDVAQRAGILTSLDTDQWGQLYAAAPGSGRVVKFDRHLNELVEFDAGHSPRAFHIPFATRTDHRDGSVKRVGQGSALMVQDWTGQTGLSLVRLGVDLASLNVTAAEDVIATAHLTEHSNVSAQILDDAGRVVQEKSIGALDAGTIDLRLTAAELAGLAAGDYELRVHAASTYESGGDAEIAAPFSWNGGLGAVANVATLGVAEPNPFRASTSIRFSIPAGARDHSLAVYDVAGRLVRSLSSGPADAGSHAVSWDGRDGAGHQVAAGVYLTRLVVDGETSTGKLVHLR
ncbi:MAG: FlgD immunoglobulin-like domain containing protein [bacterium]